MKRTPASRSMEAFWLNLLNRYAAYWSGPGRDALEKWRGAGIHVSGLDSLLDGWLTWSVSGAWDDFKQVVRLLARETPREGPTEQQKEVTRSANALTGSGGLEHKFWFGFNVEPVVDLITALSDEQRAMVRELLERGMAAELSIDETITELQKFVGLNRRQAAALSRAEERLSKRFSGETLAKKVDRLRKKAIRYRAEMIARTSYQRLLQEYAVNKGAQGPGGKLAFKTWLVTPDERLCQLCAQMDGKEAFIKNPFALPDGRHVQLPSESHPNCRCALVLRIQVANSEFFSREAEQRRYEMYLDMLPPSERAAVAEKVEQVMASLREAIGEEGIERLRAYHAESAKQNVEMIRGIIDGHFAELLEKGGETVELARRAGKVVRSLLERGLPKSLPTHLVEGFEGKLPQSLRFFANVDVKPVKLQVIDGFFVRGEYSREEQTIRLRAGFDPEEFDATFAHEMGHHIDDTFLPPGLRGQLTSLSRELLRMFQSSGEAIDAAKLFRIESGMFIFPNAIDPYVGRYYSDGGTEVLSSLIESLFHPRVAGVFCERSLLAHVIYALRLY